MNANAYSLVILAFCVAFIAVETLLLINVRKSKINPSDGDRIGRLIGRILLLGFIILTLFLYVRSGGDMGDFYVLGSRIINGDFFQ